MAKIGDELVRDVAHRMRADQQPVPPCRFILTVDSRRYRRPEWLRASTSPSLHFTMFSEILSWRSLLRAPAPFNDGSTIGAHAPHRMTSVSATA